MEQRDERGERRPDVAPQVQLGRVAKSQLLRFEVDLDATGGPRLGQELPVGVVRAEHHEGVAVLHLPEARPGAQQSELLRVVGDVGRHHLLSTQSRDDPRSGPPGGLEHLVGRAVRAVADQEGDFAAGVDDLGGFGDLGGRRSQSC